MHATCRHALRRRPGARAGGRSRPPPRAPPPRAAQRGGRATQLVARFPPLGRLGRRAPALARTTARRPRPSRWLTVGAVGQAGIMTRAFTEEDVAAFERRVTSIRSTSMSWRTHRSMLPSFMECSTHPCSGPFATLVPASSTWSKT